MQNSKSVLLVDDDVDDQEIFMEALGRIENATLFDVANNGKEAIYRLKNSFVLPALIFMDINMPMMDGIECFSEIINNPKTKNIPVVFLSSDTQKMDMVINLGAKGFIKKANDGEALRVEIEKMINLDFRLNSGKTGRNDICL